MSSRAGAFWRILAGNLAVTLALMALLEVICRVAGLVPASYSGLAYDNDPQLGPWAQPSQTAAQRSPCYASESIHINSLGMRDRERSVERPSSVKRRIAVLGDSFAQALQVGDEETVSRRLEAKLGTATEVLNFGVSSVGTAVELLLYRQRVRPFRPDVVLLFFFVGNDVSDNLPELKRKNDPSMGATAPYLLEDADGKLKELPEPGRAHRTPRLIRMAGRLALGQWLHVGYQRLRARMAAGRARKGAASPSVGTSSLAASPPTLDPGDPVVQRAWVLTEKLLARLQDEVKRDGARLALVVLPSDVGQITEKGTVIESNRYASERLALFAGKQSLPLLDLAKVFLELHRTVGPAALTFSCDGHWNRRGHEVVATALERFLGEQGWLK